MGLEMIAIEKEDLLKLIDNIGHPKTLEDCLEINKILEKYEIERRIKW